MSNPTFKQGPISFTVKEHVKKFRLVKVEAAGISHATAVGPVFGAVTEAGDPEPTSSVSVLGHPHIVAVHIGPATVPLEVSGNASDINPGDTVYAADDGKVSKTGTIPVGTAVRAGVGTTAKILLALPYIN